MGETRRLDEAEIAYQAWQSPKRHGIKLRNPYPMLHSSFLNEHYTIGEKYALGRGQVSFPHRSVPIDEDFGHVEDASTRFARLVFEHLPSPRDARALRVRGRLVDKQNTCRTLAVALAPTSEKDPESERAIEC